MYPVLPLLCKLTSVSSVPSDLGSPGATCLCVCSHHWHFLGIFWSASVDFVGCLTSWLCNSTLPQEMKTLKDCGGGQCQMEVQNTEARLAMGNLIRADDLSCRFHVMDSVLQGEDKEVQQCSTIFFISPKTPETGTTCSIVLGVFLPKMCEGSSGNDGV